MARVKGTAVQSSLRYVKERFGQAALTRVITGLAPPDRAAFEEGVLASCWYPMDLFLHFMQEAQRQLGPEQPDVVAKMGRASCEYGMTTIYRIFFKVGSPEFVISRAAAVFSSYYDAGGIRIVENGPGRAVVELTGFEDGAPQFCERLHGWMQRILELAGAKHARSLHSLCVHRGDAVCRFEGSWE